MGHISDVGVYSSLVVGDGSRDQVKIGPTYRENAIVPSETCITIVLMTVRIDPATLAQAKV
ncbi:MAG: hypothetical protein ACWGQW_18600 [bacterium]